MKAFQEEYMYINLVLVKRSEREHEYINVGVSLGVIMRSIMLPLSWLGKCTCWMKPKKSVNYLNN